MATFAYRAAMAEQKIPRPSAPAASPAAVDFSSSNRNRARAGRRSGRTTRPGRRTTSRRCRRRRQTPKQFLQIRALARRAAGRLTVTRQVLEVPAAATALVFKRGIGYSTRRMPILAAVMPAPRVAVELREFPRPALEDGSVLLETLYSEVCGTDVHIWHGRLAGVPYPIIPGHVSVGVADKVRGRRARRRRLVRLREGDIASCSSTSIGRAAAAGPARSTRTPTRCESRRVYGITDSAERRAVRRLVAGDLSRARRGAGAVCPTRVPLETYIGGGCGLITAVHIIETRALIRSGDTVARAGHRRRRPERDRAGEAVGRRRCVIAIGAPADRLALARAMGADVAVDIQTDRRSGAARRDRHDADHGGVAWTWRSRPRGSAARDRRGARPRSATAAATSSPGTTPTPGHSPINAHQQINRKHLEIRGCWGSEVGHFVRALRVLERHHAAIPWRDDRRAHAMRSIELNQALADAEAMRLPEALVQPT